MPHGERDTSDPAGAPGDQPATDQNPDQSSAIPASPGRGNLGLIPLALALIFGMIGGLGAFTFGYGEGAAYLSNDPSACANCHVMQGHYDSWQASSHRHVATCNDCHLSDHPIGKWVVKADNGFFHSLAFTTGNFPEPIHIKPRNRVVTQNACLSCHGDFVHEMLPVTPGGDMPSCVHCHSDVGHAHRR